MNMRAPVLFCVAFSLSWLQSCAFAPLGRWSPTEANVGCQLRPHCRPSSAKGWNRPVPPRVRSAPVEQSDASDAPTKDSAGAAASSPPAEPKKGGAATLPASKRLITGLAFLTGWADVALIAKYKTFATMMTGNTMWMASACVDGRYGDVGYYASVIASYVAGLAVFRRADLSLREKSLSRVCAPLVAGLFCASDCLGWIDPSSRLLPVAMLSMAFAIVNSVGNEVGGTMTFVLTGHMTKLTALGVDRVSRAAGRKRPAKGDVSVAARSSIVIGAFFAGALWACGLFAKAPHLLQRGAFSAMGLLFGGLFFWQDRENLGAWWLRDDEHMCEIDALETTCT